MNKKRVAVTVGSALLGGLLLLGGCAPAAPPGSSAGAAPESAGTQAVRVITAKEAKAMMDAGGVTVVDVRRADEYAERHIPSAVLAPNETIEEEAARRLPDKNAVLLVYCRTGVRSRQASDTLAALGYAHIYDMGGITSWPYETESGAWPDEQ